jgi:hypothetical protein
MRPRALLTLLAPIAALMSCAADDPIAAQLVINEIGATGNDFVEFYNTSAGPLDVSGYGACDSRTDGLPRLSRVVGFAPGTTVPSHGYLVVLFEGECPAASSAYVCVRQPITLGGGVSQSNGETLHLVNPDNESVAAARYPAQGAASGWTYGRFPDGTGSLGVTRRTPGSTNMQ